ncbi:hypothetical protein AKJ16_DCAP27716 [Drosera capensis]
MMFDPMMVLFFIMVFLKALKGLRWSP